MARARNIKPGFFRNADLVELPVETRLLFIGLWTLADREGRLEDRPRQIKMELFPADQFDVGAMLGQLQLSKFINRYEVDSMKFIEVENFIKHQDPHYKEKASEIPPPPGRENFMRAVTVTRTQRLRILERDGSACKGCGSVDALCIDHIFPVSRGGDSSDGNLQVLCSACNTKKGNKIDGEEANSRQRRINVDPNLNQRNRPSPSDSLIPDSLIPDSLKEKDTHTPLRSDWVLPNAWGQWAITSNPHWTPEVVRTVAERFAAHFRSKGTTSADWLATWQLWCGDPLTQKSHSPPKTSPKTVPAIAITVPSKDEQATQEFLAERARSAAEDDQRTPEQRSAMLQQLRETRQRMKAA